MKKLSFFMLAGFLLACSGPAENATQSKTASIDLRTDALTEWIKTLTSHEELRQKLNDFEQQAHAQDDFAQWCADPDILDILKSTHKKHLIDDTNAAIQILTDIADSGTSFIPKNLQEIQSLVPKIQNSPQIQSFHFQEDDLTNLEKGLRSIGFAPQNLDNPEQTFVELLQGPECQKLLPRYCQIAQQNQKNLADTIQTQTKLDALIACDLTAWAGELRLNYTKNDYRFDRVQKFLSPKQIVSIRKQNFLYDLSKNGVRAAFDRITPPDPQYHLLIQSRKIYTKAIADGGWPKIQHIPSKPTEAVLGKSYEYVPSLRARLNAEAYQAGDENNPVFDQQLKDAILLYRELHQLSQKKVVDAVLFKNLAVSPQNRLETIDLAIQKYRELPIGSLNYYLKVNIPDFYVEVWKDKQRVARHRIVVGNDKVQRDPITNEIVPDPETLYPLHPNRTPIQTSKINEIILNPYWNVPARIRIEELEPKLAENPNYYIENHYEEVNKEDPKLYYVRELPNPKNSLGKVKFMFPNPHNTYLHDTPAKSVFSNPTRAFSHGCMRVQDPMKLAELLLKNDGQWDSKKIHGILNADPLEQVPIELNHPVDVDVVYINARVDDKGPVAFLSDVYQYDAVRTGKVVLKKLPKPKK